MTRLMTLLMLGLTGLALTACASRGGELPLATPKACAELKAAPELSPERLLLSEGYSMLARDARTLASVKLLLYVKFEGEEFDRHVSEVSAFGKRLRGELQDIDRDYPGVRIDLDPLPVLEKRKRLSTGIDKFADIAPIVGKSGPEFERVILISLNNGLNQERHLVEEMAEIETDAGLKKFLVRTQGEMDRLYAASEQLLERNYYKRFSEKGESKKK